MPRSRLTPLALLLLLTLAALSQAACVLPPECDPNSGLYDPQKCETPELFEFLNRLAYGVQGNTGLPGRTPCPPSLVCQYPDCSRVDENGDFESPPSQGGTLPTLWFGDAVKQSLIQRCNNHLSLQFIATTPNGPSVSVSSQAFQVFNYRSLIPEEADRATLRRVRVWAALFGPRPLPTGDDDSEFSVQIHAYSGDPAAFPSSGDPEVFLPGVLGLLDETRHTVLYTGDGVEEWQSVQAELWLPEGTDYFVVLLEAIENVRNEETDAEFSSHYMDDVRVVIDGGNTAPVAAPDPAQTPENQPIVIPVLRNDRDRTSRIDPASVVIEQPSAFGATIPNPNGTVTFTPAPGFTGNAGFAYSVADEEGLRSNEATVSVIVFRQAGSCPAQSLLVCTNPNAPFCEQRVANGDFAGPALNPVNLPSQTGLWSGIGLAVVGPSQGIVPCQGPRMLQFVSTEDNPNFSSLLPVTQLVDLRDAATQNVIEAGDVTVKVRALFNRVAGDAETDTRFDILVRTYEGDPSDYPQQTGTPLGPTTLQTLLSDADPATWEEAYAEVALDARTSYIALWLIARENVVDDFPPGVIEFDGHFVDNVRVVLDRE